MTTTPDDDGGDFGSEWITAWIDPGDPWHGGHTIAADQAGFVLDESMTVVDTPAGLVRLAHALLARFGPMTT